MKKKLKRSERSKHQSKKEKKIALADECDINKKKIYECTNAIMTTEKPVEIFTRRTIKSQKLQAKKNKKQKK